MQNALLNLVINARDAMPRGGRLTIEISHARLDADYAQMYPEVRTGRYVLIAVTDTGAGMSGEVRQRAFEPFFTTKPAGAGTGLGLSMVYGFVKQSGGNIQLYSEEGRGTSVRIFLPLAESADAPARAGVRAHERDAMLRGSETILVVEDDARVRRVAIARSRRLGYQVLEADERGRGLAMLAERPEVAMIFTDVVMPGGMSGDELAEAALKWQGRRSKSCSRPGTRAGGRAAGLGAHAWLKKPYTAAELAKMIHNILRG